MRQSTTSKNELFDASNIKIGVALTRFNSDITEAMLNNLTQEATTYQISLENISVFRVPGAVELPLLLQNMALSEEFDCLVALGCVIRGDTTHYEYVCRYAVDGILKVNLGFNMPIGFGVLTVENHHQALARIDMGFEALEASLQSLKNIQDLADLAILSEED